LAEKATTTTVIQTAFGMAAIGGGSVIFSRKPDVLLDSPAVLETETHIVCPVRMTLECRSLIIVRRKSKIRLNSNSSFKTDSKAVLCVRIIQFRGQMIVLRGADEILANPLAIFQTTPNVI
jgi:hypothetical protein